MVKLILGTFLVKGHSLRNLVIVSFSYCPFKLKGGWKTPFNNFKALESERFVLFSVKRTAYLVKLFSVQSHYFFHKKDVFSPTLYLDKYVFELLLSS